MEKCYFCNEETTFGKDFDYSTNNKIIFCEECFAKKMKKTPDQEPIDKFTAWCPLPIKHKKQ